MAIEDFRTVDTDSPIEADLCVVGSGPAGFAIAEELRDSGLRILVLESGGLEPEADAEALNEIECVGVPLFNGRNRILGGTSHTWGGRCLAFDDIDYQDRPWVRFSGWPFEAAAVAPYLARAGELLGAGTHRADGRRPDGLAAPPAVDPGLLRNVCWLFGRDGASPKPIHFGQHLRARRDANLRILTHATVTHLNVGRSGKHLESVEIADPQGRRATVRVRAAVLCAGGVENARILLYSNRVRPEGVGNAHDVVGRFLMDHPRDPDMILRFDRRDADRVRAIFGPCKHGRAQDRLVFVHGLALSAELQRREGLLNCAAWPFEVLAPDDPVDAAKRLVAGPRERSVRDLGLIIAQPGIMLRALHTGLVQHQSVRHKIDRIGFLATSEQCPDPDSRIRLGQRRDRLGLPLAQIDWRVGAQERASQAALAHLIRREFRRLGLPPAHLADWVHDSRRKDAAFVDSCHPTGTTRMSSDPRHGVVDANCQVHGIDGLCIAGSSVFPTGGHANPTLMIVALAIRLAHLLRERLASTTDARSARPPAGLVLSAHL